MFLFPGLSRKEEFCSKLCQWNDKRGNIYRQKEEWTHQNLAPNFLWNGVFSIVRNGRSTDIHEKVLRGLGEDLATAVSVCRILMCHVVCDIHSSPPTPGPSVSGTSPLASWKHPPAHDAWQYTHVITCDQHCHANMISINTYVTIMF